MGEVGDGRRDDVAAPAATVSRSESGEITAKEKATSDMKKPCGSRESSGGDGAKGNNEDNAPRVFDVHGDAGGGGEVPQGAGFGEPPHLGDLQIDRVGGVI